MTGLRKGELASLKPSSFDLNGSPPTLTFDAKHSKHRKKEVLPLHLELVEILRSWTLGMKSDKKIFPKLDRRKTWLMAKKDLESAGIPYQTEEGIADFHAAGRHTHITGLLRNGATLPEAQKLARHSDIKMTMKYTHIGMEDQARAVSHLPTRGLSSKTNDDTPHSALQMRCIPGVFEGHCMSSDGTVTEVNNDENPCGDRGLGVESHSLAMSDKMEAAGIEPASCESWGAVSTCVVVHLILAAFATNDGLAGRAVHNEFNFKRSQH